VSAKHPTIVGISLPKRLNTPLSNELSPASFALNGLKTLSGQHTCSDHTQQLPIRPIDDVHFGKHLRPAQRHKVVGAKGMQCLAIAKTFEEIHVHLSQNRIYVEKDIALPLFSQL
jgi:hypothetical protein